MRINIHGLACPSQIGGSCYILYIDVPKNAQFPIMRLIQNQDLV